jgi:hypothetical protein
MNFFFPSRAECVHRNLIICRRYCPIDTEIMDFCNPKFGGVFAENQTAPKQKRQDRDDPAV